ncbi:DgyrCDS9791 [Dimorphilus gyrociliatus]|uniref:DgyrCDS9791 n=1 Tax=Dimorphilus gyrociliatus TaxID=2664684 RepID=A0A7I8VZN8_9ANNE|nr:DgyrCDS9791 [Dimorphilus gyrociliatus]
MDTVDLIASQMEKNNFTDDNMIPGNFLASQLKAIYNDSSSLFCQSVYSNPKHKKTRWASLYHTDFIPLMEQKPTSVRSDNLFRRASRGLQRSNSLIVKKKDKSPGEITDRAMSAKIFSSWKVPDRLTENNYERKENELEEKVEPKVQNKIPSPTSIGVGAGRVNSSKSGSVSLPGLPFSKISKPNSPKKIQSKDDQPEIKTRSLSPKQPKSLRVKQLLQSFPNGPNGKREECIQAVRSDSTFVSANDRKLIERALSPTRRKADPCQTVQDWLKRATDKDKVAAIDFFKSLVNSKLQDSSADNEETVKLLKILETLDKNRPAGTYTLPNGSQYKDPGFRYIRQLTPATRTNRWMYTTWHHLPPENEAAPPVNNTSSHYAKTQTLPQRHYVVHPDLG